MRILEHDLVYNLKPICHGHKCHLVIQYRRDGCVGRTFTSQKLYRILIRLDILHFALSNSLRAYRYHGDIFESEAVTH